MWIDGEKEDYVELDDCDTCKFGKMLGSYTERNNWCDLHSRQCDPFKYVCDDFKKKQ